MLPKLLFLPFLILISCTHIKPAPRALEKNMKQNYSPAWPHGDIKQIFNNVFMVTGTNIIVFDGLRLQDSLNMVVIRQNGELSLINSVRLNDEGLKSLESLGQIKNIIRIGAFHGRHDAFYQHRYGAKLWGFADTEISHGEKLDFDIATTPLPIDDAEIMFFQSTKKKEALLVLAREGGVLIACDSIKNWTKKDEFFDDETFEFMKKSGSIGEALIDTTWVSAMQPQKIELEKILKLNFKHLLSAHGEPLKNKAKAAVEKSILSKVRAR